MRRPFVGLVLATASLPAAAPAQPSPELPPPTVVLIRPAAAPVPALKYRVVPERRELVQGNAAVFYHRAIEMILKAWQQAQKDPSGAGKPGPPVNPEELIQRWITGPLKEIPRDQARDQLRRYANALTEIELAAARQTCDWEFDLRKEGFGLLLPDIQDMRSLGRLVALRARLAILDGQTDEAMHWIEIGFVMARHVSQGPTLIQSLVGCAIDGGIAKAFEELIQAPGTPSLYWALAVRPRPFIDLTAALEGERYTLERELPGLRELDSGPWTLEKARSFGDELQEKLGMLTGSAALINPDRGAGPPGLGTPRLQDLPQRLAMAAMVAKVYPEAKRALIAQGRPAAAVEAMPAIQVAAIYTLQSYYQVRDDVYKWTGLPYWQSYRGMDEAVSRSTACLQNPNPLLALYTLLIPSLNGARLASVRVDRQLDAFQCIEAIRLYAAAHDGALPPSLESISEAPVPVDPATNKPFEYKVSGATAAFGAPVPPGAPDHPSYMIRYELKLAR